MIFDSHAHYDSEQFDIDRDELLGSVLPQKGVVAVINMAADYESLKKTVALCEKYDYIYGAVGIHPECANDLPDNWKRCFPTRKSSPSARSASTTTGRTSARAKSRKRCLSPSWSSRKNTTCPSSSTTARPTAI